MARVAVCGGHGFETAGKRTPPMPRTNKVIREWEFNHPTSRYLAEELQKVKHQVIHTSDTMLDTSLTVRANRANHFKADVYASIHYNAENHLFDKYVDGVETLYYAGSIEGKKLAEFIQKELVRATGRRDRGVKARTDLGLLKLTKMPAVIVECGFMDNEKEAATMLDPAFQRRCAEAVARGIDTYLKSKVQPKVVVNAKTVKINIRGKMVIVPGYMKDGINYVYVAGEAVPIREVLQSVGLIVRWDDDTKVVIAT